MSSTVSNTIGEAEINTKVTELEDSTFNGDPASALQSLKLNDGTAPPLRPGYGVGGSKVQVLANYFELICKKATPIHRYSLSVIAEQQPKGKKLARIIKTLIDTNMKTFDLCSDFRSFFITSYRAKNDRSELPVVYLPEGVTDSKYAERYQVQVKYDTTFNFNDLLQYLRSPEITLAEPGSKQNLIQAMNIIVGHGFKDSNSITSQANRHVPFSGSNVETQKLHPGLEAFRGYLLSARCASGRLLLNTQVKQIALYEPGPLENMLEALAAGSNANRFDYEKAEAFIKGMGVKLTHFQPNRNKKITGFASQHDGTGQNRPRVNGYAAKPDQVSFFNENARRYETVEKYFEANYRVTKKSNYPVINTSGRANPTYTHASVCHIQPGQPFRHRLGPDHTKSMIRFAVRNPSANATSITSHGLNLLKTHSNPMLLKFGWQVSELLVKVEARVLRSPSLKYQNNNRRNASNGSWNLHHVKFINAGRLPAWSAICINIRGKHPTFQNLKSFEDYVNNTFKPALTNYGITASLCANSRFLELRDDIDYFQSISSLFDQISKEPGAKKSLLVVLPSNSSNIYNAVKRAGDIVYGITTICVVGKNFVKSNNAQLFGNIALKFNLKCGGANHELEPKDLGFIAENKTMVVGLDVTHPAPGEDTAPSIAAIVASVNKTCTQWPAHIELQTERQEMVQSLQAMMRSRLRRWQTGNTTLPEQILVYRDGVSEGQYNQVRTIELTSIREACKELYSPKQIEAGLPRISIVIVGKRHNTRFYSTGTKTNQIGHNKPGTVIDRGVTETRVWDFFLQAHQPIQGTARPAHYVVVHDEIFRYNALSSPKIPGDGRSAGQRAADTLEMITHNLCYLQGRATKAVSVVPPAYYADLACERARRWLSRLYSDYSPVAGGSAEANRATTAEITPHQHIRDTMFYI